MTKKENKTNELKEIIIREKNTHKLMAIIPFNGSDDRLLSRSDIEVILNTDKEYQIAEDKENQEIYVEEK